MFITLQDYMNNPAGKGSNVIPNRQLIKDDFKKRYDRIVSSKKFQQNVYMVDDKYIFHIKVPSEDLEKNIAYDVIIEFYPNNKTMLGDFNIKNYGIRLFSNAPSFVYTYAYVYNKNKILASGSQGKFNDITLESKPETRNPRLIISFEKTIYFACLHLSSSSKYMSKLYLETVAKKLDIKKLYSKIKSGDEIEVEYGKEAQKKRRRKEKEKKTEISHRPLSSPIKPITSKRESIGRIKPKEKTQPKNKMTKSKKISPSRKTYKKI